MSSALMAAMVGMPVGTAQAASSSSSSKSKVTKKKSAKKKSVKKTTISTSMESAAEVSGVIRVMQAEGVLMEGPALGEKAAKIAKKYVGYAYIYAGASPSTGFDCSGLTQYAYKKAGVSIWRSAQDQYNYCKKLKNKVKKSDIAVGDLLFFGSSTSSITHVGIYLGDDKFVHAVNPSQGVRITKLSKRTNWVAAGRPYEE